MKLPKNPKLVAIFILLISAGILSLIIFEQVEQSRRINEAVESGLAVDISPDYLQRNLRIFLAMLFSGMALGSKRMSWVALILSALIFVPIEILNQFHREVSFDTPEPEIRFVAEILILLSIAFTFRKMNHVILSILALVFILIEYLFWVLQTRILITDLGVQYIYPNTSLNNIFYGANWWHVGILLLSISLLIWEVIYYVRDLRHRRHAR
ncbi:MAG: hypothetical protein AB1757_19990 [Acidobacteriota bacterium]